MKNLRILATWGKKKKGELLKVCRVFLGENEAQVITLVHNNMEPKNIN
jgi:hypothetical protein